MAWPTLTLPLSNSTNRLPTTGIASGTPVTILQAQYPTWSQGSEYPVTPKDTVVTANVTPVTQVNSLGFLNPPVRVNTENV